jgi:hypothetical protein
MSMPTATPADAMVGTATALAAKAKPNSNAFRVTFIQDSF